MTKEKRNPHHGSTLDSFLKEEGVLEEFRAAAVKEVIAWQIRQAMSGNLCRCTGYVSILDSLTELLGGQG